MLEKMTIEEVSKLTKLPIEEIEKLVIISKDEEEHSWAFLLFYFIKKQFTNKHKQLKIAFHKINYSTAFYISEDALHPIIYNTL